MSLQNKISIDISAINPLTKEYNYATITLPATPMEIEDAFQKARVTKDGEYFVEIISSPKVPKLGEVYIDGEKNIVELNLLAKKLSLLDDNQLTAFNALFENSIDDDMMAPSLEELINMTDGLGKVIPVHGITTDEQLGEFVIDNNLSEVLQTASDDVLEYVSTKIVGQKFREMENGVFYNGAYIPLGAYEKQYGYKSPSKEQLEVKNHYAFALNIAEAPVNDSEETADSAEWIYLPADKEYINGIARIHNEGCIRNVYSLYVQGLSLKEITDRLNQIPITYAGDGRAWDKNIVKRMLENPKYTGAKGYPIIIPPETAELALKLKEEKVATVAKEDKPRLDTYRKIAECAICGSKMKRRHAGSGKRRRTYWNCSNPECDGNHHTFHEKVLDKLMTEVVNELAGNMEMVEHNEISEFEKDTEIIRASNEMNEAIDNIEMDSEAVIGKIMALASLKFDRCTIGSNTAITESIKQKLAIYDDTLRDNYNI